MKQIFISAVNKLIDDMSGVIARFDAIKDTVLDTTSLQAEKKNLEADLLAVSQMQEQNIHENAHIVMDQTEYKRKYDELDARYDSLKARIDELAETISTNEARKALIKQFIIDLKAVGEKVDTFDANIWAALVDYVTVYSKDDIRVTFKDGTEIKA